MAKRFYSTNPEEQETIINVDYYAKEVNCYTSRKAQIERLTKKLGDPTETSYTDKKISGASWKVPFTDKKRLSSIFSRTVIIGQL